MSSITSETGKRRVKRTYEVTRQNDNAVRIEPSSLGEEEDKEAKDKNSALQPKRSRYDPNKVFSNTNQGPEKNNLKGEQLGSQKKSSKYDEKITSNNELTTKKGLLGDSENETKYASSNSKFNVEVTHKIKNAKESDKINRQRMWEEQQLRNAMAGQSDHPDDITLEGSDKYDYVFDTDAMIDYTNEEDDLLPEEKLQYEARLAQALETEEKRILTIQEARKLLPVHQYKDELLQEIKKNQVLIIMGETGSGKPHSYPNIW
ncbi:DEAH-box RNA-dependent ATPase [Saccharomyces cerevisiae]|nr:DEAH-box RNA-dependent ATPase [Saccharomyces cerevisiae]